MLTERQAWLKIAEAFEEADDYARINRRHSRFLCPCIAILCDTGEISDTVYRVMTDKVDAVVPPSHAFAWEPGDHSSRAAFCRKQAKLLARKPAKKKRLTAKRK